MPKKDIFHDTVITALKKEGWVITNTYFCTNGKNKKISKSNSYHFGVVRGYSIAFHARRRK